MAPTAPETTALPTRTVVLPTRQYDTATLARLDALDALDAASAAYAAARRPATTRRSYDADWRTWQRFVAATGIPETAAVRVGVIRAYVVWLWETQRYAPTTIDRRLTGLAVMLRAHHGIDIPRHVTRAARELLRDLTREAAEARQAPRGRGKAPAVTVDMLRAMVATCGDDLTGLRDRALLLLAFAIAGRRHEVAGLSVRDIELVGGRGLLVHVRVSKTEPRTVRVPYATDRALCPVRAWLAWQAAAGLTDPDSPALRRMHRTGTVTRAGLTGQSVGAIITAAGTRSGFTGLTGHSMRAGLITSARAAGKDRKAIAATSGHVDGSAVLEGYIRAEDGWSAENNALAGLL